MPRMPDATSFGAPPSLSGGGGVASYSAVDMSGAGRELSRAGADVEQAAQLVAETNGRQDAIVAQAAANKLALARITAEFDTNNGFRNVKGEGAVGPDFLKTYDDRFGGVTDQLRTNLSNPNQQRIFDKHAAVELLQFKSALLQHQARETETFNDKTADDGLAIALRTMARDPTNELAFQTGLAQINGIIDGVGKRKGVPVDEVKGKYLDAAYTTRILSVMQGVPGAVNANPYAAEKMFEQIRDQLGPQSQVHLGQQVQKAVQSVQARDTAKAFIFGNGATAPNDIASAITGKPLQAVVESLESGGNPNAVGPVTRTGERAQSSMQVMPATSANPGFGVIPAKDNSPEEMARVGRDYLGAMTARYNEPALVLAAYNAGPGQVDKWIAKFGDPRSGRITPQEWAAKVPFAETQNYVVAGLKKLAVSSGNPDAPINAPTANQLKTDLYSRVQQARSIAEQQYPGDTAYADAVAARVENYGRTVLANQQAEQGAARDTLMMGVIGQKQDGSDKPQTVDALLADPQMKAAWDRATPETKDALLTRFAKGAKGFDEDSFKVYYGLKGQAVNDPNAFMQVDLGKYFGQIPDSALHELTVQQGSISKHDAAQADRDLNWRKARSVVDDMLKPIGMGATAKANTTKSKDTEVFYGRLNDAIQQYHDQNNNKWPDTQTMRSFAAGLLSEGKQSGGIFYDSSTRAYQAEDPSKFYVPLPSDRTKREALQQSFIKVTGHSPSDAELQRWYTQYKLAGGK